MNGTGCVVVSGVAAASGAGGEVRVEFHRFLEVVLPGGRLSAQRDRLGRERQQFRQPLAPPLDGGDIPGHTPVVVVGWPVTVVLRKIGDPAYLVGPPPGESGHGGGKLRQAGLPVALGESTPTAAQQSRAKATLRSVACGSLASGHA